MSAPDTVRAGGLRSIRFVLVVLCLATVLNTGANITGFRSSQKTSAALCALRGDLERRVASSRAFLRDHPDGIPGIPAKTIRDSIANQKRSIDALHDLSCK